MSDKINERLSNDVIIADVLIRLTTLENLLIEKGVFSKEEFSKATSEMASKVAKSILQQAHIPADVDALVKNLPGFSKFE